MYRPSFLSTYQLNLPGPAMSNLFDFFDLTLFTYHFVFVVQVIREIYCYVVAVKYFIRCIHQEEHMDFSPFLSQPAPFILGTSKASTCLKDAPKCDNDTLKKQRCAYTVDGKLVCDGTRQIGYNMILNDMSTSEKHYAN